MKVFKVLALLLLISGNVNAQCPESFQPQRVMLASSNLIRFQWDAIPGVDRYLVQRNSSLSSDPSVWNETSFNTGGAGGNLPLVVFNARLPVTLAGDEVTFRIIPLGSQGQTLCMREVEVFVEPSLEARRSLMRLIIPVVGSLAGAHGSRFRSTVELSNVRLDATMRGKLVFHPAGRVANASDPSLPYELAPGGVVVYPDVVVAMGAIGLGSLDIVPEDRGSLDVRLSGFRVPIPQVQSRLISEAASGGEYGADIPALAAEKAIPENPERVFGTPATSRLIIPHDYGKVRVNIGIRTISTGLPLPAFGDHAPPFLQAQLIRGGKTLETVLRDYPAEYMEQFPAESLFTSALLAGDVIVFDSSAAFVYWTITNNATNDPAFFMNPDLSLRPARIRGCLGFGLC